MGIELKVDPEGNVIVTKVALNGAAERASDSNGNCCPIREGDEIIDINGTPLIV